MTVTGSGLLGSPPDPSAPIRISFQVWGQAATWDELMATARRIEALGFSSLFANDHLMPILGNADGPVVGSAGSTFEGWMTLAGFALATKRIPLGMMVSGVGYRNVGLTVKMATALDHASRGRAILGLGAGWHEPEHRTFGYPMLGLRDRISRLDEASRVARGLLDGQTVSFEGDWVSATGLYNDPPPTQARMPLLIGGSGERRTLRIVARDADIWNGEGDPTTYTHKNAVLSSHCQDIGRDPASIRRTVGISPICIRSSREAAVLALTDILARQGGDPAAARAWAASSPLADTADAVREQLRAWRAAGAEEAVVDLPTPLDDATLETLATMIDPLPHRTEVG